MFLKHAFKEFNWKFAKHLCLEANSVAVLPLPNGSDGAEWLGGCDNSPGQMCLATQGNQEMNTEGNFFDIWNFFSCSCKFEDQIQFFLKKFLEIFRKIFSVLLQPPFATQKRCCRSFCQPTHPLPFVSGSPGAPRHRRLFSSLPLVACLHKKPHIDMGTICNFAVSPFICSQHRRRQVEMRGCVP